MSVPTWGGCVVPAELLYDPRADVWARLEAGEATVGMTDIAQTRCGRLVQISWKSPGTRVRRGRPLGVIESAKWVGPFLSPLSGEILSTNAARFVEDVAIANRDPYGEGWFVRLRPDALGSELGELVDGPAAYDHYRALIDQEGIRCFRCAE